MRLISSQVWLRVSQTSVVKEPRTARAFSRAALRQEMMDEGLLSSLTMNSITFCGLTSPCSLVYMGMSSLMDSKPCQPCRAAACDWGSMEVS